MSRTYRKSDGDRRIRVQGVRRNPPDLKRLSRALIELAAAQTEMDAEADAKAQKRDSGEARNAPSTNPQVAPPGQEGSE
jgi:hypothetical protein